MRGDVALAGDLTLDLDALAVRLVRVAAPFADEFAARRASAKLERALHEQVASFTAAFARGPGAGAAGVAGAAGAAGAAAPRHTLVLPAAADVLAVVTDRPHAQIVGLFLRGDTSSDDKSSEVFDPFDADEARDVLRSVLPSAVARFASERLAATRRWARFGEAGGESVFVRVPNADDPASFFPTDEKKETVAVAVSLASEPKVLWRARDDDDDDFIDARGGTSRTNDANDTKTTPSRHLRDLRDEKKVVTEPKPDTPDTQQRTTHVLAFPGGVRVFATRLAFPSASSAIAAANGDASFSASSAASFATAAPLLREEALVVGFHPEPPPAYGHTSFEAFLEAFAAEYGVSLPALTRLRENQSLKNGDADRGRVAELRFRRDGEARFVKRLWPSCLLLARHGATEVPARTVRGNVAATTLKELVEDLNDDGDARVPTTPFGATLKMSLSLMKKVGTATTETAPFARNSLQKKAPSSVDAILRRASESPRLGDAREACLLPVADLLRPDAFSNALVEAASEEADDAFLVCENASRENASRPAPAPPRPPPRRLAIPSAFRERSSCGADAESSLADRASPAPEVSEAAEEASGPEAPEETRAEKENLAAAEAEPPAPPKKKPRFASFKTAAAATPKPTPKPKPSFKTTADPSSPPSPPFPPLAAAAAAAEAERARQAEILAFLEAPVGHGAAALPPDAARAELEESFEAVLSPGAEAEPNRDRDPAEATSVEANYSYEAAARDEREARAAADAEAMPPPPPRLPAVAASAPAASAPPSAPPPPPAPRPPKKKRAPTFSAFGFFSRAVRPTLARGLSLAEQTRALGEKWRLAEQSAKDAFAEEARRAKEAYLASSNPSNPSSSSSEADDGTVPSAPRSEKETKKRKAPPPADPEAAEAFLRERFAADGGDVGAFSAFLKGKNVSSDKLGAFLKKHDVPNVKRMKKEERVEKTVATLTRVLKGPEEAKADA